MKVSKAERKLLVEIIQQDLTQAWLEREGDKQKQKNRAVAKVKWTLKNLIFWRYARRDYSEKPGQPLAVAKAAPAK